MLEVEELLDKEGLSLTSRLDAAVRKFWNVPLFFSALQEAASGSDSQLLLELGYVGMIR